MFWLSRWSKVQRENVKLFAAICRIYWLLVAAKKHHWGKFHSLCMQSTMDFGGDGSFGFSVLIPRRMDGACSVRALLVTGTFLQSLWWHCQHSHLPVLPHAALCKDRELHWDILWPKAGMLPLFHMDQHNNAQFPLPYSFKSRVEKYRLQTGVRVSSSLSLF